MGGGQVNDTWVAVRSISFGSPHVPRAHMGSHRTCGGAYRYISKEDTKPGKCYAPFSRHVPGEVFGRHVLHPLLQRLLQVKVARTRARPTQHRSTANESQPPAVSQQSSATSSDAAIISRQECRRNCLPMRRGHRDEHHAFSPDRDEHLSHHALTPHERGRRCLQRCGCESERTPERNTFNDLAPCLLVLL